MNRTNGLERHAHHPKIWPRMIARHVERRKQKRAQKDMHLPCPLYEHHPNFYSACFGKHFSDVCRLRQHLCEKHLESSEFCEECGTGFGSSWYLHRHTCKGSIANVNKLIEAQRKSPFGVLSNDMKSKTKRGRSPMTLSNIKTRLVERCREDGTHDCTPAIRIHNFTIIVEKAAASENRLSDESDLQDFSNILPEDQPYHSSFPANIDESVLNISHQRQPFYGQNPNYIPPKDAVICQKTFPEHQFPYDTCIPINLPQNYNGGTFYWKDIHPDSSGPQHSQIPWGTSHQSQMFFPDYSSQYAGLRAKSEQSISLSRLQYAQSLGILSHPGARFENHFPTGSTFAGDHGGLYAGALDEACPRTSPERTMVLRNAEYFQ